MKLSLIMTKKNWTTPVLRVLKLEETRSGVSGNNENPNNPKTFKFSDAAGSI